MLRNNKLFFVLNFLMRQIIKITHCKVSTIDLKLTEGALSRVIDDCLIHVYYMQQHFNSILLNNF